MDLTINYNEQMLNYYPEVIKAIREFQVITETQSVEIANLHWEIFNTLGNAYITSADEPKISQWEHLLGISPLPQGEDDFSRWLDDRRATIIARLYSPEKLNSTSINEIVNIFTGGSARSWFKNGTVYVEITPPPDNRQYKFANVEQEISKKIPAHLAFEISRNYYEWGEILNSHPTWGDVSNEFDSWEDILLTVATQPALINLVETIKNAHLNSSLAVGETDLYWEYNGYDVFCYEFSKPVKGGKVKIEGNLGETFGDEAADCVLLLIDGVVAIAQNSITIDPFNVNGRNTWEITLPTDVAVNGIYLNSRGGTPPVCTYIK